MPGGKTDVRWSEGEWAALERLAELRGMRPGQLVKAIVRDGPLAAASRVVGPAAPEERESQRSSSAAAVAQGDAEGRSPGAGPAAASSRMAGGPGAGGALWHEGLGVAAQQPRPVGSAGSGVRPPAGGSAADSSRVAEPAGGMRLVDACVAVLAGQGVPVGRARLLALREIRAGRVEVSGEVCSDPERLVDPASLGAPA